MLHIHNAIVVIHHTYLDCLPNWGRDLKKDRLYNGLCPYLHNAISFAMAELPKREQPTPRLTPCTLLQKS